MQAAAVFYDSECVGVEGAKNRIGFMIMEICCASFNNQELHLAADFSQKEERGASFGDRPWYKRERVYLVERLVSSKRLSILH